MARSAVLKSKMPPINGCTSKDAARTVPFVGRERMHDWRHSNSWNGNDKRVLPFHSGTSGIARSGWRCYNCGEFVWDQTDVEFALKFAYHMNLLPDFSRLMAGADARVTLQSTDKHMRAAVISNERKHAKNSG